MPVSSGGAYDAAAALTIRRPAAFPAWLEMRDRDIRLQLAVHFRPFGGLPLDWAVQWTLFVTRHFKSAKPPRGA